MAIAFCISTPTLPPFFPVSPFLSLSSRQWSPSWKCDRSYSFLCCIAFAWGHRETAENLCRYYLPFNSFCLQPTVSKKWPPVQRLDLQALDRRSPIQVLTQHETDLGDRLVPDTCQTPNAVGCFLNIIHLLIYIL